MFTSDFLYKNIKPLIDNQIMKDQNNKEKWLLEEFINPLNLSVSKKELESLLDKNHNKENIK